MSYINLTKENIESEHICCAIGDKKHEEGVKLKKEWIKSQLSDNHVFRKADVHGKVFIEYSPLEKAWVPINGENYLYIYCLWVAGSYKGNGYAKDLIEYAINDAKTQNKNGICVLSSKKKKPFLSEEGFLEKYGFKKVDQINDFDLMALSFNDKVPSFTDSAKKMEIEDKTPTIYYTNECPYVVRCIEEINEYIKEKNINVNINHITSLEDAKNLPCVFNNWAVFIDGKFTSLTLLNKNSFAKLIEK